MRLEGERSTRQGVIQIHCKANLPNLGHVKWGAVLRENTSDASDKSLGIEAPGPRFDMVFAQIALEGPTRDRQAILLPVARQQLSGNEIPGCDMADGLVHQIRGDLRSQDVAP